MKVMGCHAMHDLSLKKFPNDDLHCSRPVLSQTLPLDHVKIHPEDIQIPSHSHLELHSCVTSIKYTQNKDSVNKFDNPTSVSDKEMREFFSEMSDWSQDEIQKCLDSLPDVNAQLFHPRISEGNVPKIGNQESVNIQKFTSGTKNSALPATFLYDAEGSHEIAQLFHPKVSGGNVPKIGNQKCANIHKFTSGIKNMASPPTLLKDEGSHKIAVDSSSLTTPNSIITIENPWYCNNLKPSGSESSLPNTPLIHIESPVPKSGLDVKGSHKIEVDSSSWTTPNSIITIENPWYCNNLKPSCSESSLPNTPLIHIESPVPKSGLDINVMDETKCNTFKEFQSDQPNSQSCSDALAINNCWDYQHQHCYSTKLDDDILPIPCFLNCEDLNRMPAQDIVNRLQNTSDFNAKLILDGLHLK